MILLQLLTLGGTVHIASLAINAVLCTLIAPVVAVLVLVPLALARDKNQAAMDGARAGQRPFDYGATIGGVRNSYVPQHARSMRGVLRNSAADNSFGANALPLRTTPPDPTRSSGANALPLRSTPPDPTHSSGAALISHPVRRSGGGGEAADYGGRGGSRRAGPVNEGAERCPTGLPLDGAMAVYLPPVPPHEGEGCKHDDDDAEQWRARWNPAYNGGKASGPNGMRGTSSHSGRRRRTSSGVAEGASGSASVSSGALPPGGDRRTHDPSSRVREREHERGGSQRVLSPPGRQPCSVGGVGLGVLSQRVHHNPFHGIDDVSDEGCGKARAPAGRAIGEAVSGDGGYGSLGGGSSFRDAEAAAVKRASPVVASYVRDSHTHAAQYEHEASARDMEQSVYLPDVRADMAAAATQQLGTHASLGTTTLDERVRLAASVISVVRMFLQRLSSLFAGCCVRGGNVRHAVPNIAF